MSTQAATIWVGLEDIALPAGDQDYNDMILSFSGVGLAVLGQGAWQPMPAPNLDGSSFWDNASWDGPNRAVGYHIEPEAWYWGIGSLPDRIFEFSALGAVSATLLSEESAWQAQNALYWQDSSGTHLLFSGNDGPGVQGSFQPNGAFGLRWETPDGTFSSAGQGEQFAVFRAAHSPEPEALPLVGIGLLLIGRWRRRGCA
jgi:hypothetical protein